MFTPEEIRKWCNKYWAISLKRVEIRPSKEEVQRFYDRWLSLMLYLIDRGYDRKGVFAETAIKLLELKKTNPEIVSFDYPFTRGSRDIGKLTETVAFFIELSEVCTLMEKERRDS